MSYAEEDISQACEGGPNEGVERGALCEVEKDKMVHDEPGRGHRKDNQEQAGGFQFIVRQKIITAREAVFEINHRAQSDFFRRFIAKNRRNPGILKDES